MGILRADILTHSQLESAGGSVDFDGSGDYLTIPNHTAFHFTGDYTIDFYIKFSTNSGTQRIFGQRNSNASDISVLGEFASNNFYYYYSTNGSSTVNMIIGTYGTNIELNTWHHVAIVSDGGVHHAYLDGVLTAVNENNSPPLNDGDSTWSIGRQGAYTANEFSGSIYGFRITHKALYKTNFTLSKFKPKVLPETILLCCVSSTSVTEAEVSAAGDITSNGDPQVSTDTPLLKEDITDTGVVFDGFGNFATSTYMVPPKGKTTERNRGRAVFTGGYNAPQTGTTEMEFFNIQSGGLTEEFGNQSINRKFSAGLASATRGVTGGSNGTPSWVTGTMEFVTIANASNTTTFGNMTAAGGMVSAHSNDTRGLFFSVWDASGSGPAHKGHIDYITIATTGNSADFGQLSVSRPEAAGFGSPTRGICAGGYPAADGTTMSNVIDYVTISTLGNATDFGDLTQARQAVSGASSQTRGVVAGGYVYGSPAGTFNINTIDYITIATTGDALDFGDLIVGAMAKSVGNCSDQTRGVFTGGKTAAPTYINTIEIVTIATTGNASDFGDLKRTRAYGSVFCDSHGGFS